MSKEIIVSPSILSADFANLEREIKKVEDNGADWIHVDVMDGHFVPNITIGVPVVKSVKAVTKLPLDVHLMIDNPEKYAKDFIQAGANILTFHIESIGVNSELKVKSLINEIKNSGCMAGMSIKPKTKVNEIMPYLKYLDLVLVMTVEPGFGGQSFMSDCALKISEIKKYSSEKLIIQVDGGINDKTSKICTNYGAKLLVAGNYIYKS